MISTYQRLDAAARHLHLAAAAAERQAGDSPAPELRTIAALARTTAALISPTRAQPDADADAEVGIAWSLSAALEVLESIEPGDGPADLPLLEWHVDDLRRVASQARP